MSKRLENKRKYLKKGDTVQVVSNHLKYPNIKATVMSVYARSPRGTSDVFEYVWLRENKDSWPFTVLFEQVVKIENGKPVPYIEEVEARRQKEEKPMKKNRRRKEYHDREIEWGQYLRFDLRDKSVIIRSHASVSDRYANTDLNMKLRREKKLRRAWPKHTGWVVRPKGGTDNDWIFVGSLEEAEEFPMLPPEGETTEQEADFEIVLELEESGEEFVGEAEF
tara:strand:+ start:385 stop:1050 length:666 start_codon:yes stop_codon:yes gene_type:complete